MSKDDHLLENRLSELAQRARSRGCYVYSEFLTLAEQDVLCTLQSKYAPFCLKGGYDTAERRLACFGNEEVCGYTEEAPIACMLISPLSRKFAGELRNRDILGALMALGIRRSLLGDIIICQNYAYLFCLESVSGFIALQLEKVGNTAVSCVLTKAPDIINEPPECSTVNVSSERLDAIIAAVYKLSRGESQLLITQRRVFVNSRLTESASFLPGEGCIISVRGIGRFIYEGVEGQTRRGRLRVSVRVF